MAKVTVNNLLRVVIDGQELRYVGRLEMTRDSNSIGPFMGDNQMIYKVSDNLATVRVESAYITIEAAVEYTEIDSNGTIHIYGPLRRAFPDLFKARELKPWQLAYIKRQVGYVHKKELKYSNDDDIFTTVEAAWFKKGWKAHEQTSESR